MSRKRPAAEFFILPYPQMSDTKYLLVKGEEYDNKS